MLRVIHRGQLSTIIPITSPLHDQQTMIDSMEIPVHDVVNTGTELLREGLPGKQGFITVTLTREAANQPWGFRLQGGKDRGLPFQLLKVIFSRQTRTEARIK